VSYQVDIGRSAERELKALPSEISRRIGARLRALETDPRPPQATRLRNSPNYRLRVGTYRAIYSIDDGAQTVTVLAVGHRREIYRDQ
jgi:mRNA interferase RelE/StbE